MMPELPEVEVVRRSLKNQILNQEIKAVDLLYESIFIGNPEELKKALIGSKFIDILRYGKYLVFVLDNDFMLISHLRMEGKYLIREDEQVLKHEHVIFTFENSKTLRYHDTRKFGRMELRTKENYLITNPLAKLGKEPANLTGDELYMKLQKTKRPIKVALLDQTIIAGLGNIYVDEVLFLSKLRPETISSTISLKKAKEIVEHAVIVLNKAIQLGGTTIYTYSATDIDGLFQNELLVHTKAGELCPVCQTIIEKIKVGGRGTYVCRNCQK